MNTRTQHLECGREIHDVRVRREGAAVTLTDGEEAFDLVVAAERDGELLVERDGVLRRVSWARDGEDVWVCVDGVTRRLRRTQRTREDVESDDGAARAELRAPMTGKVTRVAKSRGDAVEGGETVVVLEAMKMEHALRAPFAGIVTDVSAEIGSQTDQGAVLAVVEREGAGA